MRKQYDADLDEAPRFERIQHPKRKGRDEQRVRRERDALEERRNARKWKEQQRWS